MQVSTLGKRERLAGSVAERLKEPHRAIERLRRLAEPPGCASREGDSARDVGLGLRDSDATSDQHGLLEDRHRELVVLAD